MRCLPRSRCSCGNQPRQFAAGMEGASVRHAPVVPDTCAADLRYMVARCQGSGNVVAAAAALPPARGLPVRARSGRRYAVGPRMALIRLSVSEFTRPRLSTRSRDFHRRGNDIAETSSVIPANAGMIFPHSVGSDARPSFPRKRRRIHIKYREKIRKYGYPNLSLFLPMYLFWADIDGLRRTLAYFSARCAAIPPPDARCRPAPGARAFERLCLGFNEWMKVVMDRTHCRF